MLLGMVILGVMILALAVHGVILGISNAKLWIELKAMKGSTHQFTVFNPDPKSREEFQKMNDQLRKALEENDMGDLESIQ